MLCADCRMRWYFFTARTVSAEKLAMGTCSWNLFDSLSVAKRHPNRLNRFARDSTSIIVAANCCKSLRSLSPYDATSLIGAPSLDGGAAEGGGTWRASDTTRLFA